MDQHDVRIEALLKVISLLTSLVIFLLLVMFFIPVYFYYGDAIISTFKNEIATKRKPVDVEEVIPKEIFWSAPSITSIEDIKLRKKVEYGRDLIAHTSKYLGPKGIVMQITNGMNCQNCHLSAGTKIFGNNYSAVASTYPKFRPRSGTQEDIYKRVNDCVLRSLNGTPLDTLGREMQAIKAYISFIGSNVEKGVKPNGAGLKELAYLDREADPAKGKIVYDTKCKTCHQEEGQGQLSPVSNEYTYPPLWGIHSYNEGAGLYRISNFAKYVKNNMPLGATHHKPQLTDEEAWDVAAFVNSQYHPHLDVTGDWPDITLKPVDYPFGPYSDTFTEQQHKFGPFKPIVDAQKSQSSLSVK